MNNSENFIDKLFIKICEYGRDNLGNAYHIEDIADLIIGAINNK
jgi:hypothetical protein